MDFLKPKSFFGLNYTSSLSESYLTIFFLCTPQRGDFVDFLCLQLPPMNHFMLPSGHILAVQNCVRSRFMTSAQLCCIFLQGILEQQDKGWVCSSGGAELKGQSDFRVEVVVIGHDPADGVSQEADFLREKRRIREKVIWPQGENWEWQSLAAQWLSQIHQPAYASQNVVTQ